MKKILTVVWIMAISISVLALSGCSAKSSTSSEASTDNTVTESSSKDTGSTSNSTSDSQESDTDSSVSAVVFEESELFSDRDYETDYEESTAVTISLDNLDGIDASGVTVEESVVTITEEGVYILSGTMADGQIVVDASSEEKVQLVLDGVSITNSTTSAIYVKQADKVFITLARDSENVVASTFATTSIAEEDAAEVDDSTNVDAAIFSHDDLTLNGEGSLTVTSIDGNGITSKDDLVITSGTYLVSTNHHGLEANDGLLIADGNISLYCDGGKGLKCDELIYIAGGTFYVVATDDAIHSDNDVYIVDGDMELLTADDGIHADFKVVINGGNITLSYCYEGIEGQQIEINDGNISIYGMDDGINADLCDNAVDTDVYIHINGGIIQMDTYYEGDGFDSNGSIEVSGGYVVISSTTEERDTALDSQEESVITGGTFIGTGSDGMTTQNFEEESTQCSIFTTLDSWQSGTLTLTDSAGNVIISIEPAKEYQAILISSPDLQVGEVYTLTAGSETQTIDLDESIYGTGQDSGNSMSGGTFVQPGSSSRR